MISSLGICFKNDKTYSLLKTFPEEHPVTVQLFGSHPEKLAQAAKIVEDLGFDIIDINMGCPAPKILKSNSGGALLKDLKLIENIITKTVNAISIPVTIKIRVGYKEDEFKAIEVAKIAESRGAKAIAVHGSTVMQKEKGSKNWDAIKKVKENVKIPVIANGGVKTPQDLIKILDHTGADAVMIGRAALGRPWFFEDSLKVLSGEGINLTKKIDVSLLFETLFEHIKLEKEIRDDYTAVRELRKHIPYYLKDLPESGRVKDSVNKAKSIEELLLILRNYKNTFF
jgi:nifR3 family TIM-barrel protein